jgi:hypothetical protein
MRFALLAVLLAVAAPAAAQVDDDLPLEVRISLYALYWAEEAAEDFERALSRADSTDGASDMTRRLQQRALEGTVEAARAALMLEMAALLRAEAGDETPAVEEEMELSRLLRTLQTYGDDLVEVDACAEGKEAFDYEAAAERAGPTFERVRELTAALREGIEDPEEGEEDRP